MTDVNDEWENFINDKNETLKVSEVSEEPEFIPTFTDLYISTQTKIGYLNQPINLNKIFWKIPILDYHEAKEGIIKKIMKINSVTPEEVIELEENINTEKNVSVDIISNVNCVTGESVTFKDIRKITVGISKKDLINFRKKKKSAFYNCFATIVRIFYKGEFREINIKLFNTGKLEIPGIQNIETLNIALEILLNEINKLVETPIKYLEDKIETVLINSNFSCNFYINRTSLYQILKYTYNIHSLYDPCSYPGIQCKFFYNKNATKINGLCNCKKKCSLNKKFKKNNKCDIVSFMIFRTGSILIVGNCNEKTLRKIYLHVINILIENCYKIKSSCIKFIKKPKKRKYRKRIVLFSE
jgi:TATA-box binding protein (TBP) (component of TFIID and TFIIIB)